MLKGIMDTNTKSVKIKDKPVLVLKCTHGIVFQKTALLKTQISLDEIFNDTNPDDEVEIVSADNQPKFGSCQSCGF